MMDKRVLVVEDDYSIACLLRDNLEFEGFEVACAADGDDALLRAAAFNPDLVLLDLMLPGRSGFEVCRTLHANYPDVAILILTACEATVDKIQGLDLGADDYLTKPFDLGELLARVHAVLRRTRSNPERLLLGDLVVDFRLFTAERSGVSVIFTRREFDILRYFSEHADTVVSREDLLRAVWGYRETPSTRTVDNFIARLRRKIEQDPRRPRFLHTAYGDGYILSTAE